MARTKRSKFKYKNLNAKSGIILAMALRDESSRAMIQERKEDAEAISLFLRTSSRTIKENGWTLYAWFMFNVKYLPNIDLIQKWIGEENISIAVLTDYGSRCFGLDSDIPKKDESPFSLRICTNTIYGEDKQFTILVNTDNGLCLTMFGFSRDGMVGVRSEYPMRGWNRIIAAINSKNIEEQDKMRYVSALVSSGPPCSYCEHYCPNMNKTSHGATEISVCQAEDMFSDYSCFYPKAKRDSLLSIDAEFETRS